MQDEPSEKIVTHRSASQDEGRRYLYSQKPNVPRVRVILETEHEERDLWNALVDFAFFLPYEDLSQTQRVLHLIMLYNSEVHNGGHGQYFANEGMDHLEELLRALEQVGAHQQQDILKAASATTMPKRAGGIRGILGYVSYARQNEKYDYDQEYFSCRPPADELAVGFAKANLDEFVKLL